MPDLLDPVDALAEIGDRAPCSDAERRAAEWLRADLRRRGHAAWVEPVWTRPQWSAALLWHAGLGVLGSILSVSVPLAGVVLAAVAALGLALEAGGRLSPVRRLFRRRATQVVVTEPDDPELIELILCAGYDAPRRGLVFRDPLRRLAARGRLLGPLGWLALAALAVAAGSGARLAGFDPQWLGAVQFVPTVALLLAFAAAVDIALSDVAPGASEPLSGAAVALALHDELAARPPEELSVSLLLAGASENLPAAVAWRHLRRERLDRTRAVVLELGACGAGEPVLATRHPQLRTAAARGGIALAAARRPTAWRAARSLRLPAALLACRDASGIAPRVRQGADLPDALDPGAAQDAFDAALDLIDALDEALVARRSAELAGDQTAA